MSCRHEPLGRWVSEPDQNQVLLFQKTQSKNIFLSTYLNFNRHADRVIVVFIIYVTINQYPIFPWRNIHKASLKFYNLNRLIFYLSRFMLCFFFCFLFFIMSLIHSNLTSQGRLDLSCHSSNLLWIFFPSALQTTQPPKVLFPPERQDTVIEAAPGKKH